MPEATIACPLAIALPRACWKQLKALAPHQGREEIAAARVEREGDFARSN